MQKAPRQKWLTPPNNLSAKDSSLSSDEELNIRDEIFAPYLINIYKG